MTDSNGSFFGSDWLGAFLIIAVLFNGGGGIFGGGGNAAALDSAINNQSTQQSLQALLLSSANNNYETARLISDQNMVMMQTNNANQINAIQGFNQVTQAINGLGSELRQSISQLGYQLESCCCSIKTQMLQDKYEALENLYRSAQTDISNAAQTQTLLNTMGKWVANPAATAA